MKTNTHTISKLIIATSLAVLLLLQPLTVFSDNSLNTTEPPTTDSQWSPFDSTDSEESLGSSSSSSPIELGDSSQITPFATGVTADVTNQTLIDGMAWMSNNTINPMYTETEVMASILPVDNPDKKLNWSATVNIPYPAEGIFTFPKSSIAGESVTVRLVPTMNGIGTFTIASNEDPSKQAQILIAGDTKSPRIQDLRVVDASATRLESDRNKQLIFSAEDILFDDVRSGIDLDNLYYMTSTSTIAPNLNPFVPNGTDGWTRYIQNQENLIVPPPGSQNGDGFYVHVGMFDRIGNRRREVFRGNDYDWTGSDPIPDPELITITKAEGMTVSTTQPQIDGKYYIKGGNIIPVIGTLLPDTVVEKTVLWSESSNLLASFPATSQSGAEITVATAKKDGITTLTGTAKARPNPVDSIELYVDSTPPTFTKIHIEEIPQTRGLETSNDLNLLLLLEDKPMNTVASGGDWSRVYYISSPDLSPSFDEGNPTSGGWTAYDQLSPTNQIALPSNGETFYVFAVAYDKVGNITRPYAFGEIVDDDGNTGPGGEEGGTEIPINVTKATDIEIEIVGEVLGIDGVTKYIKGGSSVSASAAVLPAAVVNKKVLWQSSDPNVTFSKSSTTDPDDSTTINTIDTFDGSVIITAKADSQSTPSKTKTINIDSTPPDIDPVVIDTLTVHPFTVDVTITSDDLPANQVASGVEKMYYKSSLAPTNVLDPSNPAAGHWKLYVDGGENHVESMGAGVPFYLITASVDYVGNISYRNYHEQIIITEDNEPPQLTLPNQHHFVGDSVVALPTTDAEAWDSVDATVDIADSTFNPPSLTIAPDHPLGVELVEYSLLDASGNLGKGDQKFFVHGKPRITANDVEVHWRDTADIFTLIESQQIKPDAAASVVLPTGNIITDRIPRKNIDILIDGTSPNIDDLPWGQLGATATITYKTTYTHPYSGTVFHLEKMINFKVVDNLTDPPNIGLNGLDPEWFYIGGSPMINITTFWGKVTVTGNDSGEPTKSVTMTNSLGDPVTLGGALNTPDSYKIHLKAVAPDGKSAYYDLILNVVGAITISSPSPVVHTTTLAGGILPESDYTGANGYTATFVNHQKQTVSAAITNPSNISIANPGAQTLTYSIGYPAEYLGAPVPVSQARTLRVHDLPKVTVANPIPLYSLDDNRGNFLFFEDTRIQLAITAQYVDENNQLQSFDFKLPETTHIALAESVNFTVPADYPATYTASYPVPEWNTLSGSANTIFRVVAGHDPNMPIITAPSPIRYFTGLTDPNALKTEIMNNATVTNQAGKPYPEAVLSFDVLKGTLPLPDWTAALSKPGEYTLRYKAVGIGGHSALHEIKLQVIGELVLETSNPIDVFMESGEVLPADRYTGDNAPLAYFRDFDGNLKSVDVIAANSNGSATIPIDQLGHKQIRYTAKYPAEYNNPTTQNHKVEKLRLVRVHGLPVFENLLDLQLRTPRTTAERQTLIADISQGLNTPTAPKATIQVAGRNLGDQPFTMTATVSVSFNPTLNRIQQIPLTYEADFTLPAGYERESVSSTDDTHTATLHGNVEIIASNLVVSTSITAATFPPYADSHMHLTSSVKYYNPADPANPTVHNIHMNTSSYEPDPSPILWGAASTAPHYLLLYKANDTSIARPVGLAAQNSERPVRLIIDNFVGVPPTINNVPNEIQWLDTVSFSKADALFGVTAEDEDAGGNTIDITGDLTVTATDSLDGSVAITSTTSLLPVGVYTLTYEIIDSDLNPVTETSTLYVSSPMNPISSPPSDFILHTKSLPYRPNLNKMELNFQDGSLDNLGSGNSALVHITKVTHSYLYSTDKPSYDISTVREVPGILTITHPIFGDEFVRPATGATTPTIFRHNFKLLVYGRIAMTGYEKYDSTATIRQPESYFVVGNSTTKDDLLVGVVATREAPDGSGSKTEIIPVNLYANSFNMSIPNVFPAIYRATDPVFQTETVEGIAPIQVDSMPVVETIEKPIFVQSGSSLAAVVAEAKVSAYIYYGNAPTVAAPLSPSQLKLMDTGSNTEISVVGPVGQIQHLHIAAVHPNIPTAITELDVSVIPLKKPVISFATSEDVVLFRGEGTLEEIKAKLNPTYTYYDKNGNPITKPAELDLSSVRLDTAGVYAVKATMLEPQSGSIIESEERYVYVINRAYIKTMPLFNVYDVITNKTTLDDVESVVVAIGIGEYVEGTTRAIGSKQILTETFSIKKDVSNVVLSAFETKQLVRLSGEFWYSDQKVSYDTSVVLHSGTVPNPDPDPGNPGGGGSGEGGTTKPDDDVNLLPGDPSNPTGNNGNGVEKLSFWRAVERLILNKGSKHEVWKIAAKDYLNPKQIGSNHSSILAVPEEHLQMPLYVTEALQKQKNTTMQLDLGDYYWQLSSDSKWSKTDISHYEIGVRGTNSSRITQLLGATTPQQQLHFGFAGGWNSKATLGVRIDNAKLQNEKLYMYYYNPNRDSLELVGSMTNLENNWSSINVLGYYGDYVVTTKFIENIRIMESDNPSTGGPQGVYYSTKDSPSQPSESLSDEPVETPFSNDITMINPNPLEDSATPSLFRFIAAAFGSSILVLIIIVCIYHRQKKKKSRI